MLQQTDISIVLIQTLRVVIIGVHLLVHPKASLLRTAGGGEATASRSAQALQGRTEAEPEDLRNTTNRAQPRHDCLRILAISLP